MRIGDRTSVETDVRETITLVLKSHRDEEGNVNVEDSVSFTIGQMPLDHGETLLDRLPQPLPPRKPLRLDGKPVRDEQTKRPMFYDDERDPAYLASVRNWQRRSGMATFVASVHGDPTVRFDAEEPGDDAKSEAWEVYYDGIFDELRAFGLKQAHFIQITRAAARINKVPEEQIEEAIKAF